MPIVDKSITELTGYTLPIDTDVIPIVDITTSETKKITWANITATLNTSYLVKTGISGGQTVIGGTGVTDILKLQGTSGNGTLTSPAIQLLVGNNGATVAFTVLNNGKVGIGTTGPTQKLEVAGNILATGGTIYNGNTTHRWTANGA